MKILLLSLAVAAAVLRPTVLPGPAASATYHFAFAGHFWNGELTKIDRVDTLQTASDGVDLSQVDKDSSRTTKTHGALKADGSLSFMDAHAPSNPFDPYNSIALLIAGASSLDLGSKWDAKLPVQIGPVASDLTQVPVTASVAKRDGDILIVQGTGATSAIATYGEYKNPIDLTVQVAARFSAGTLQRADYKAKEYVHAGPLSQTMTWTWSLVRE